jgi:hypothetical protein
VSAQIRVRASGALISSIESLLGGGSVLVQ